MELLMLLIVVADMNLASKLHAACIRALQFIDNLEDGRLSGAIVADDRYLFTSVNLKTDV